MSDIRVSFAGHEGVLAYGRYPNGRLALLIVDEEEDDDVIVTITANLPDMDMDEDEVAVKTYSENEGIIKALDPTRILVEQVGVESNGFAIFPVYKVDMDLLESCRKY